MLDSVILWRQCKSEEGRWGQTMLNDEVGAQHSYVANALGVDAEMMNNHPYDLKLLKGVLYWFAGMTRHPMESFVTVN